MGEITNAQKPEAGISTSLGRKFYIWLVEPSKTLKNTITREKFRSLSLLLLILAGMNLIDALFAKSPTVLIAAAVGLIASYLLTRSKYYMAGGVLAIAVYSVVPFASMIVGNNYEQDRVAAIFIWLVIPLLLSSLIFSLKGMGWLIISYITAIALLPIIIVEITFGQISNLLTFLVAVAGSILMITQVRETNIKNLAAHEERGHVANIVRKNEQRYYNLFEHANDAIFIIDPETLMFLDVNKNASEQLGYSREELLGMGIEDIYSSELKGENRKIMEQLLSQGSVLFENRHIRKDGAELLVEVSSRVVDLGNRKVFQSIVRDISERKYAEDQMRQYADRLAALHEIEHTMISAQSPEEITGVALSRLRKVILCKRTSITQFNYESQKVMVYALSEEPSENISFSLGEQLSFGEFKIPDELYKGEMGIETDLLEKQELSVLEKKLITIGIHSTVKIPLTIQGELWGSLNLGGPIETKSFPAHSIDVAQEVAGLVSVALQQAELFLEIRMGRARLQALSRRLVEAQEAERYRIANELHDEIGQALTGINLALGTYMRNKDKEQDYAPLLSAQTMAEELVVRVQRMSLDLRPAMLDDLGLLPTLTWHFDRYKGQTGIEVLFDHQNIQGRFPREIETAGYRIIQEALTNVARHAGVDEVRVRTSMNDDVLLIFIEDRGEGFSVDSALASGNASGLVGMRERALSLGGDLKIIATEETGTQVLAELPLKARVERRRSRR